MEKRTPRIIAGIAIIVCTIFLCFSIVRGSLIGSFVVVMLEDNYDESRVVVGDSYELYSRASKLNDQISQISSELDFSNEVAARSVVASRSVASMSEGVDESEVLGPTDDDSSEPSSDPIIRRIGCEAPGCDVRNRSEIRDLSDIPDEPPEATIDSSLPSESSGGSSDSRAEVHKTEKVERAENRKVTLQKLDNLVFERNQLMNTLARSNPELFLSSRLSSDVLRKLPRSLEHKVEKPVRLRGYVVPTSSGDYFVSKNEILMLYSTNGVRTNSIAAMEVSGFRLGNIVVADTPDIKKISPFFIDQNK